MIQPYTRVHIPFISKTLNVPESEVESLLVTLILDNRISGHIDQVNQLLEVGDKSTGSSQYAAMGKWANQLTTLHHNVLNKLSV